MKKKISNYLLLFLNNNFWGGNWKSAIIKPTAICRFIGHCKEVPAFAVHRYPPAVDLAFILRTVLVDQFHPFSYAQLINPVYPLASHEVALNHRACACG